MMAVQLQALCDSSTPDCGTAMVEAPAYPPLWLVYCTFSRLSVHRDASHALL